eukprot:CAMPEP_0202878270 /NCGR_PEP_ID=MMETSP1391-20130828/31921_1 /ASSEMBLY_ACC=CAM_ASM_000867 /TAXON_ID=1034604 /ORGANISM="Chlamydomonas leiostraca, Strain SAG 11-49" /LENGTH=681 /DNA_ID=CAMNT_0049560435 /DNA_START=98 /DNA_END=2143 /DNA_ORIENTATION=+
MGCVQSAPAATGPSYAQLQGPGDYKQNNVQQDNAGCVNQVPNQLGSVGPALRHGASTSNPGQPSYTDDWNLMNKRASSDGLAPGDHGQQGPGSCLTTSLSVPGPAGAVCVCRDAPPLSRGGGLADHGQSMASAVSNVSTCSCGSSRQDNNAECPELPAAVASLPLPVLVARLEAASIKAYTAEHHRGDSGSSRLLDYYSTCNLDLSPEHRALSCHLVRMQWTPFAGMDWQTLASLPPGKPLPHLKARQRSPVRQPHLPLAPHQQPQPAASTAPAMARTGVRPPMQQQLQSSGSLQRQLSNASGSTVGVRPPMQQQVGSKPASHPLPGTTSSDAVHVAQLRSQGSGPATDSLQHKLRSAVAAKQLDLKPSSGIPSQTFSRSQSYAVWPQGSNTTPPARTEDSTGSNPGTPPTSTQLWTMAGTASGPGSSLVQQLALQNKHLEAKLMQQAAQLSTQAYANKQHELLKRAVSSRSNNGRGRTMLDGVAASSTPGAGHHNEQAPRTSLSALAGQHAADVQEAWEVGMPGIRPGTSSSSVRQVPTPAGPRHATSVSQSITTSLLSSPSQSFSLSARSSGSQDQQGNGAAAQGPCAGPAVQVVAPNSAGVHVVGAGGSSNGAVPAAMPEHVVILPVDEDDGPRMIMEPRGAFKNLTLMQQRYLMNLIKRRWTPFEEVATGCVTYLQL